MLQPTSKMYSPKPCSVHPSPADGTAVTSVCPTAVFLMPLFGNQGSLLLVHQCYSTSDSPSLHIQAGHNLLTPGNGSPLSELCLMLLQASPSPMHNHVTCPAKPLTLKTGIHSLLPSPAFISIHSLFPSVTIALDSPAPYPNSFMSQLPEELHKLYFLCNSHSS